MSHVHDRVSVAWLGSAGVRADLELWSSTEQRLCEFPGLEAEVAALRFVPLCEWEAERPHSVLKRAVMGKASKGVRASLAMRAPEIRDALVDKATHQFFQKVFDMHTDILDVLVELGVEERPTICCALESRKGQGKADADAGKRTDGVTQSCRKVLGALLYHLGPISQLTKFKQATAHNDRRKRQLDAVDDQN